MNDLLLRKDDATASATLYRDEVTDEIVASFVVRSADLSREQIRKETFTSVHGARRWLTSCAATHGFKVGEYEVEDTVES